MRKFKYPFNPKEWSVFDWAIVTFYVVAIIVFARAYFTQ